MTTPPPADDLYTTTQAAQILGIRPALISQWQHRRRITPTKILRGPGRGGTVPLYHLDELRPHATAYHQRAHDPDDGEPC